MTSVFNDTRRYVEFTHISDDRLVPAFDDTPSIIALPTRQLQPIILNYRRPTSQRPQCFTYFSLVIIYSRRWPFTAAPAHTSGCLDTCLDTYTITNRIHTCTHDQFIVVHTFYFTIDTVQFYLPRICIYCLLFSLLVKSFLYTHILPVWSLLSCHVHNFVVSITNVVSIILYCGRRL